MKESTHQPEVSISPRAVAALYKDEITNKARELAQTLHGAQTELVFEDDPLIELACLLGAASEIYRHQLLPNDPQFQEEDFALAISEIFQEDLLEEDVLVAYDSRGEMYKINKHLLRAIKTKGDLAERRQTSLRIAETIQKKHKHKLYQLTSDLDRTLGTKPEKYRIRGFNSRQVQKFLCWMDEYKITDAAKRHMDEKARTNTYWLRAMGVYLVREQIKFKSLYDYTQYMSAIVSHREIPESSYHYAREIILRRKNMLYKLAFPLKYQRIAPDELQGYIDMLNHKYGVKDKHGTPFCLRAYYLVRKIMSSGQDYQDLYQQITRKHRSAGEMKNLNTVHDEADKQLSFHDMSLLFPPPPLAKSASNVSFTAAVKQVLAYHPNRLEQNILWQAFYMYNYYFRISQKYQGKQLTQVMQHYYQKKQHEHDQLHGLAAPEPIRHDFFSSELYCPDELIDLHVARIKPL